MSNFFLRNPLLFDLAIPLGIMLVLAPFSGHLDLAISNHFYHADSGHFSHHSFFSFFYKWGVLPGILLGVIGCLLFLASYLKESLKKWRKGFLLACLTVAIGAGLIVHLPLKEYWKRPRPRQIELFGGNEAFKTFYQPKLGEEGSFKSFPSGHAAIGFCFFALAIQGRREHNKKLFWIGLATALGLGICLGVSRIAQGAHFFSDIMASACLMWMTAAVCGYFIYKNEKAA